MPTVAYYSDWKERHWTCDCGWKGVGADADWEPFDALLQVDCPACQARVCLVCYPTDEETQDAAAAGNEEAKRAVAAAAARKQRELDAKTTKLVRATQLPMLKGVDEIDFLLWCDETGDDPVYILEANGEEIHREHAWFESNDPLRRHCRYVAKRYGERAKTFTIDTTAVMWLSGDSLRLYHEHEEILAEFGLVEKSNGDPSA